MNIRKVVQYKRDIYREFEKKKKKVQNEFSALVHKNARLVLKD